MDGKPHKVFISYAHEDAAVANEIAAALQAAQVNVWIDQQQMKPGDSFIACMNAGLADADYVLFLASKAAIASGWVSREWMSSFAAKDTVLIPIRVSDVQLPPLLRDIIYIDLTKGLAEGIQEIVQLFEKETVPPLPPTRSVRVLAGATRRELRLVAKRCLTEIDFKECLWDLNIQESDVPGNTIQDRLLFLLQRLDTDGLMEDFLSWLEENRGSCVKHQLNVLRTGGG